MSTKIIEERLLQFAGKYGNEALKEVLNIISDVREDGGTHDGDDTRGICALIEKGTEDILKERSGQ
jgi:hypothetical protein